MSIQLGTMIQITSDELKRFTVRNELNTQKLLDHVLDCSVSLYSRRMGKDPSVDKVAIDVNPETADFLKINGSIGDYQVLRDKDCPKMAFFMHEKALV